MHQFLTERDVRYASPQRPCAHRELTEVALTIATMPNGMKQKMVHRIARASRFGGGGV